MPSQTHKSISISRDKTNLTSFTDLFYEKAGILFIHGGTTTKYTLNSRFDQIFSLCQGLEKFGCGKKRTYITML